MSRITETWRRIEAVVRSRQPVELRPLPGGASLDDLRRVETEIGVELPDAVRESYLLHNGSDGIWICEQGFLLPLVASVEGPLGAYGVLDLWQGMLAIGGAMARERGSPQGPIRDEWWSRRWVPLTENGCGDCVCLDFAPAPGGRVGQVIDWWHERGATRVLAGSFEEWLAGLVTSHSPRLS